MKTRLNELSLSQFIELVCGNTAVLADENEMIDKYTLNDVASDMVMSYRLITDSANVKARMLEQEDFIKLKSRILVLHICENLIDYNAFDDVRYLLGLLDEYVLDIEDGELRDKVDELLRISLFEEHRNQDMKENESSPRQSPDKIRDFFDAEVAFLMTFFKMNIDMNVINASVYANIVHQADIAIRNKQIMR